jgi:hypothetical protein
MGLFVLHEVVEQQIAQAPQNEALELMEVSRPLPPVLRAVVPYSETDSIACRGRSASARYPGSSGSERARPATGRSPARRSPPLLDPDSRPRTLVAARTVLSVDHRLHRVAADRTGGQPQASTLIDCEAARTHETNPLTGGRQASSWGIDTSTQPCGQPLRVGPCRSLSGEPEVPMPRDPRKRGEEWASPVRMR